MDEDVREAAKSGVTAASSKFTGSDGRLKVLMYGGWTLPAEHLQTFSVFVKKSGAKLTHSNKFHFM